ncbi:hypothetical protein [Verrucomicrobium sp. 3C]|uniref:hypothetical protein n=1 Tax=Verrucomicrobium sp. 3C TaxID=1134055 RepID=UPI000363DD0F|nr:hypothetical protein [Verrucomicrobium sp. 3C]
MQKKIIGFLAFTLCLTASAAMAQVMPDARTMLIDAGASGGIFSGGLGMLKNVGYLGAIGTGAVMTPIGLATHKWGMAAAGFLAGAGGLAVSPVAMSLYAMVPHT